MELYREYPAWLIFLRRTYAVAAGVLALPFMLFWKDRARFYSYLHRVWSKTSDKPVWMDQAEKANSIFPSSDQRKQLREMHLIEARGSLMSLDRRLRHVYIILAKNPQGGFTNAKGDTLPASEATQKLDKRAQRLGELIHRENELLKGATNALSK